MTTESGIFVEKKVLEALEGARLDSYVSKVVFHLGIRKLEQLSLKEDKEFQRIGMSKEDIFRLRTEIASLPRIRRRGVPEDQVFVENSLQTGSDRTVSPHDSSIDEGVLISNEEIQLLELLGKGTISVIKRGVWQKPNSSIDVVVKVFGDVTGDALDELIKETSQLQKLEDVSLVRIHGLVLKPTMLVIEHTDAVPLLERLKDITKPIPVVTKLQDYCHQVAMALQHLEKSSIYHEKIGAKDVLLSHDDSTTKLKLPVQAPTLRSGKARRNAWLSPEAMRNRGTAEKRSIFSYGVLIWEILSFGATPWSQCTAHEIESKVRGGERLKKPSTATNEVFRLMNSCWSQNPQDRPTIDALVQKWNDMQLALQELLQIVEDSLRKIKEKSNYLHMDKDAILREYLKTNTFHKVCSFFFRGMIADNVAEILEAMLQSLLKISLSSVLETIDYLLHIQLEWLIPEVPPKSNHNWKTTMDAMELIALKQDLTYQEKWVIDKIWSRHELWRRMDKENYDFSKTSGQLWLLRSKKEIEEIKSHQRSTEDRKVADAQRLKVIKAPPTSTNDWVDRLRTRDNDAEDKDSHDVVNSFARLTIEEEPEVEDLEEEEDIDFSIPTTSSATAPRRQRIRRSGSMSFHASKQ